MKVIFKKDVPKFGRKYEVKNVSDGFAMNMLIPRGDVIPATDEALKRLDKEIKIQQGEAKVQSELLEKDLAKISEKEIVIRQKTNEKGHLFAGLHAKDISDLIKKAENINIDPSHIVLNKPIKETGNHSIVVKFGQKTVNIKIKIESL